MYSRLLAEGRDEEAGQVARAVAATAAVVTVLGVAFAEPLTLLIAPGLESREETLDLTITLVRILFPAVGLLVRRPGVSESSTATAAASCPPWRPWS